MFNESGRGTADHLLKKKITGMPTLEVVQALLGDVWLQGGNIQEDTSHISETTGAAGGRAAPCCLLSLMVLI